MTSTSQDSSAKADPGSLPGKQAEAAKDARQVPLDALAEERQKRRASEEKAAELEARLARLEGSGAAEPAQPQSEITKLAQQLAEIQAKERMREMTVELGLADTKQADAVAKILAKNSELTPTEALEIAAKRSPDIFKDRGTPGFDPRIHGSLRPTTGSTPEPKKSDFKARVDYAKKATGSDKARVYNNLVGGFAAEAMGWGRFHKKLPIPEQ